MVDVKLACGCPDARVSLLTVGKIAYISVMRGTGTVTYANRLEIRDVLTKSPESFIKELIRDDVNILHRNRICVPHF